MSLLQHYIIPQRKGLKFTPAKQEHIYMITGTSNMPFALILTKKTKNQPKQQTNTFNNV